MAAADREEPIEDVPKPSAGGDSEQTARPNHEDVTPPEGIPSTRRHPNGGMTAPGPIDTERRHQPEETPSIQRGRPMETPRRRKEFRAPRRVPQTEIELPPGAWHLLKFHSQHTLRGASVAAARILRHDSHDDGYGTVHWNVFENNFLPCAHRAGYRVNAGSHNIISLLEQGANKARYEVFWPTSNYGHDPLAIRAVQGHSGAPVDTGNDVEVNHFQTKYLYHVTYQSAIEPIMKKGLIAT